MAENIPIIGIKKSDINSFYKTDPRFEGQTEEDFIKTDTRFKTQTEELFIDTDSRFKGPTEENFVRSDSRFKGPTEEDFIRSDSRFYKKEYDNDAFYEIDPRFKNTSVKELIDMNIDLGKIGDLLNVKGHTGYIEGFSKNELLNTINISYGKGLDVVLHEKDGEYVVSYLKCSYGQYADFDMYTDLSEVEKIDIRSKVGLDKETEVNGYCTLEVNGQEIPIYWIGDDVSSGNMILAVAAIKVGLSKYPSDTLDYLINSTNFKGFYIGSQNDAPGANEYSEAVKYYSASDYLAYYDSYDDYIYVNGVDIYYDSSPVSTIVHEFAHKLDHELVKDEDNIFYSYENIEFYDLYSKYKKDIQRTFANYNVAYDSKSFPSGIPDEQEFFAVCTEIYYKDPKLLMRLYPEIYKNIAEAVHRINERN